MSSELKFFYANSLEAAMSAYDVSFKFMRNATISDKSDSSEATATAKTIKDQFGAAVESKTGVVDEIVVTMSPSHAKAMMPAMIRLVTEYERMFGKIPLDSDMQSRWDSTFTSSGKPK